MNVEDRIDVQVRIPTQVHYIFFKFSLVLFGLCWPWILRSNDGISHFSGIFPLAQGGLNPLLPDSWSSRLPGIREGSYGQFNPNTT